MEDFPSKPPVSPQRSRRRALWIRGALTVMFILGALIVLLGREDPTIFGAARERLFPVASPFPPSTQVAPTFIATFDLKSALPILQQRSLRVSALAAGAPCVAAPGRQVSPDLGPALGDGPIYMVGYGTEGTNTIYMSREDSGWYYLKTIWTASPYFHDVFLLRGRQADGPNEVRFSDDTTDVPDLQAVLSSSNAGSTQSGWIPWIDYVRVRAPGCYGIQVDGLTFSEIIRFKVIDTPYIPEG
jgi:hypothetical protein